MSSLIAGATCLAPGCKRAPPRCGNVAVFMEQSLAHPAILAITAKVRSAQKTPKQRKGAPVFT